MTLRNGILDGTKLSATERIGILFILLCLSYITDSVQILKPGWTKYRISATEFFDCIKLKLGFEKWVDNTNPRDQVFYAQPLVKP